MKMNYYQKHVMRTAKMGQTFKENLSNIGLGMTGEAGEVADLLKKHIHHGHGLNSRKLIEEAGDVLFYVAWLAESLGVTLEYVADHNVAKLQRRYPEGFSTERSINRDE
jgi:NTP pyrophosphatase (non-canonical NTP hydrolase)